jgi:septal ring factor EnvC (AmiA/AmiB activator)
MAERRWTVLFVPHGAGPSKAFPVSSSGLRVVAALGALAAVLVLATAVGVMVNAVELARNRRLERENRLLSSEIARLDQRVHTLSDTLAVLGRRDEAVRLIAGLEPLDPDVREAGIGGPSGPWAERELMAREGGALGSDAFRIAVDLDGLVRRANLLATSFKEAAESLQSNVRRLAATPSIMPTTGWLTSRFSQIRLHPILHESRPHEGIDITAAYGTPVIAPANGRVIQVGWESGYGLTVTLDHGFGLQTRYAHTSRTAVRVGQRVRRGERLGWVGSSGLSRGPHLHYEVLVNGRAVNPLRYIWPTEVVTD